MTIPNCASDDSSSHFAQSFDPNRGKPGPSTCTQVDCLSVTSPSCASEHEETASYIAQGNDPNQKGPRPNDELPKNPRPQINQITVSNGSAKQKTYKFNAAWLQMPMFSEWLKKLDKKRDGSDLVYCSICDAILSAHKSELDRHCKS